MAGTLGLSKLICLYDDNGISIDGEVDEWFSEDVPARFEAYGWRVIRNVNGHDAQEISDALKNAVESDGRPTLVCCKTVIGFGSPNKRGTAGVHGAALGEEEIALTKAELGWTAPAWEIPADIQQAWDQREAGAQAQQIGRRRWKPTSRKTLIEPPNLCGGCRANCQAAGSKPSTPLQRSNRRTR